MIEVMTSNYAAAHGARLSKVEVIAAYPITPASSIAEKLAEMSGKGELHGQYILVESEHSAMSLLIGASYVGARTFTATSSHGLALMHEMLYWATGARRPIVMTVASRAMAPPWNIWGDQMDVIGERDTGWMQFFCENNQETLDTIIMSYRIAEDRSVMLPAMVIEDGFILSHTFEAVDLPNQEEVDDFLPKFNPELKIDFNDPRRFGGLVMPDWWSEFRYRIAQDMEGARKKIVEVDKEFGKKFGRSYGGLVEFYNCDDADVVLALAGSAVGTAKHISDKMRERGKKVGVVKIKALRPLPAEELRTLNDMVSVIGVFDRSFNFGHGGGIFSEIRNGIYTPDGGPLMKNYVGGMGGRDFTPKHMEWVFEDLLRIKKEGKIDRMIEWIPLRDGTGRWY
jgi:pyruvate/2-oxoacid:ferredoxin oxidoreductase alpha subunit